MIIVLQVNSGSGALDCGSINWQKGLCFRVWIKPQSILYTLILVPGWKGKRLPGGWFSHGGSLERTRKPTKPWKHMLLTSHWPKNVTWTSPKARGREDHLSYHEDMARMWMSMTKEWSIGISNSTYNVTYNQRWCYLDFLFRISRWLKHS